MCLNVKSVTLVDVETVSKGRGGCAGKACVVAQLHEQGKWRRYSLTRGIEGLGGVMGWGEQGVSSVKAICSPIEWNDSEELVEVESFVCKQLKHLSDRVEIPRFSTPKCLFLQLFSSSLP